MKRLLYLLVSLLFIHQSILAQAPSPSGVSDEAKGFSSLIRSMMVDQELTYVLNKGKTSVPQNTFSIYQKSQSKALEELDSISVWSWDVTDQNWEQNRDTRAILPMHDSEHNLTSLTWQEKDNGQWVNATRNTYEYWAPGLPSLFTIEEWDGISWVNSHIRNYEHIMQTTKL